MSVQMQRRFRARDLVLLSVIAGLCLLIGRTMHELDQQSRELSEMQRRMGEQHDELRSLHPLIRSINPDFGSRLARSANQTASTEKPIPDVFSRAFHASTQSGFQTGDWLVSALSARLPTLTPFASTDAHASEIQRYVQETLLARDPDSLEWRGLVAERWDSSDDGLAITFKLRGNVRFSDGHPLTAHDVAFTHAFIMTDEIDAPRERVFYRTLSSVTAKSEHEVEFVFREPYFNSLAVAGKMPILPRHFYEPYLRNPREYNESRGLLLGSGPYRLADPGGWTPVDGLVELERNPRYWGPVRPTFDRLVWKVIENASARLTSYRNGEIDSYLARLHEYKRILQDAILVARSRTFEYMGPNGHYTFIGWNQRRGATDTPFADARVRRAMTFLTDRERIANEIYSGFSEPVVGPFNPASRQHEPTLQPRRFDLQRANELLREAGYEDRDDDDVLEGPDGEPFEFDMLYAQDSDDTRRMLLLLKDQYARAGVVLRPQPVEWQALLDAQKTRTFDALVSGWLSGLENDIFPIFHSSQASGTKNNFVGYKNPQLDELIDRARATIDEEARMLLWQRCEQILFEDQPYTYLLSPQSLRFVDQRIHNLQITRLGLNLSAVPIEVYVPAALQRYSR